MMIQFRPETPTVFDKLNDAKWEILPPETVSELLDGSVIRDVQTLDAPAVDGYYLILENESGTIFAVLFSVEESTLFGEDSDASSPLRCEYAVLQEGG